MMHSKVTKHSRIISDIEVLRAFAILFTLIHHVLFLLLWPSSTYSAIMGTFSFWGGVDLFLVISGFVIARQFIPTVTAARDTGDFLRLAGEFWIRRAFRILPTAWVWLAIPLALTAALPAYSNWFSTLSETFAALFQVANFHHWYELNGRAPAGGVSGAYWSLSLEEQFYLALPFVAYFGRKHIRALILAAIFIQLFIPRAPGDLLWDVRADALLVGVAIYFFSISKFYSLFDPTLLNNRPASVFVIVALLFGLAAMAGTMSLVPFFTGMIAIFSGLLVLIASYDKSYICRQRQLKALLLWVGSRSYALYLANLPIFFLNRYVYLHILGWDHPTYPRVLFSAFTALAMLILAAELNYRFVEMPLREKGKRIGRQFRERPIISEPSVREGVL
ncbi:acyltransferase family protein [Rhizobium tubonense]|uniref:Acyltransferase n=1 Tax=Rhizobium tubonense TaxID=484088 RepID=A0A2W4C267_9HYPH|nr:acyltransferase [Rhizobium tubonense]PZM07577.1 acyltransferase [Rhizobium tubonense]